MDLMSDKILSNKRNSKDDRIKSNGNHPLQASPSPPIGVDASCTAVGPMVIDGKNTDDAASSLTRSKCVSFRYLEQGFSFVMLN